MKFEYKKLDKLLTELPSSKWVSKQMIIDVVKVWIKGERKRPLNKAKVNKKAWPNEVLCPCGGNRLPNSEFCKDCI